MNRRSLFVQAIRGPVLLITIGILFAMQQANVLGFSRTWPLILIVIGIMKLFERSVAGPRQQPPPFSGPGPFGGPGQAPPFGGHGQTRPPDWPGQTPPFGGPGQ